MKQLELDYEVKVFKRLFKECEFWVGGKLLNILRYGKDFFCFIVFGIVFGIY